jgi:methylmalonyl-CoA/ethylmalonyl-CoA epimerase
MDQFRFHHVGVAVQDIQKAIPMFRELFGYELTSGPFDDPIQKVSVCFLSRGEGDLILELVAPLGDGSPVLGKLKGGGGAYHICYEVADIRASIKRLIGKRSFLISGPDPAVAFNQREIAWLMTEARILIELVQR